ncbi:MAG: hypothetical protein ACRD2E_01235 [Terriglobales bacterium]
MSKPAIIAKIERNLRDMPMSEPLAVYLLVEIRKFYDHDLQRLKERRKGDREKIFPYPTLRLCCDWVAHSALQGADAQRLLHRAADYIADTDRSPAERDEDASRYFHEVISFATLRDELADFQRRNGLEAFSTDQWNLFLEHFLGVIFECPLRFKEESNLPVDAGEVEVWLHDDRGDPPRFVFRFLKNDEMALSQTTNAWSRRDLARIAEGP